MHILTRGDGVPVLSLYGCYRLLVPLHLGEEMRGGWTGNVCVCLCV